MIPSVTSFIVIRPSRRSRSGRRRDDLDCRCAAEAPACSSMQSCAFADPSSSCANFWQRVRKRQPDGGSAGLGRSPCRTMRRRCRSFRGSGSGIAESSACVYGCAGRSNTSSTSPISTIRPRYITATRSAMCRTTDRSCATNRYDRPSAALQLFEQVDDARADRHIQRRTGSSSTSTFGSSASARAMPMRCRWPPENAWGYRLACSGCSPTSVSSSRTRRARSAGGTPCASQRLGEDVADRQPRIERRHRILEHHLQVAADRKPLARRHRAPCPCPARRSCPTSGGPG